MTKYYFENGDLFEINVMEDEFADDPREWQDDSHMWIFWNNYRLGDWQETAGRTALECLEDLVESRLPDAETFDKSPLELLEMLYADNTFLALPIYVYEHSCLQVSTSTILNPYGHWDSGLAGIIWTDKDSFPAWSEDWREDAKQALQSEVETYNAYLNGEIYAVKTTPYDFDLGSFDELDSEFIGGIYSDNYGDDLFREVAAEVTSAQLYGDLDAAISDFKKSLVKDGRVFDALRIA